MILVLMHETKWECAMASALLLSQGEKEKYVMFSVKDELAESYLRNCLADCHDYTEIVFLDVPVTPAMESLLGELYFNDSNTRRVSFESISSVETESRQKIDAIAERMRLDGIRIDYKKVVALWKTYSGTSCSPNDCTYPEMLETASDVYSDTGDATFFYHLIDSLGKGTACAETNRKEVKFMTVENSLDCYGSSLIEEAARHLPFSWSECGGIENARALVTDILDKLRNPEDNSWNTGINRYHHDLLPADYKDRNFRFTDDWSPEEYECSRCRLLGVSYGMEQLRRKIARVHGAPSAFIIGASGTGKENVARQLHYRNRGSFARFYAFNCANVNEDIIKDELFGHVKGAFTGADKDRDGLFRQANGGTVFLDEIQDMPMPIQGLLLRVLNDGEFKRQGSDRTEHTSVRIIAATNKGIQELDKMIGEGKFRADLYFRLTQVIFKIPPLCERLEDIRPIAESYWSSHASVEGGVPLGDLNANDFRELMTYDYPGNVRELQNILQRAIAMGEKDFASILIEQRELMAFLPRSGNSISEAPAGKNLDFSVRSFPITLTLNQVVHEYSKRVYEAYGNQEKAAEVLGVVVNSLKKYLKEPQKA